ncbi:MAG: retron St85 family effector protein, partial [Rhodocyclaceae bacterium]|nr:retron St85 family effector protein [Rhodocyclaceae bacterium]
MDQLRDQLDPRACRLANLPGRIWLFGGKGGFTLDTSVQCESLRDSFWRQSLSGTVSSRYTWVRDLDIPENHPGWWAFSGHGDLLAFERDACHLARAIILFPESPGSLAELGALAVDESIIDRLLVVVQSKYLHVDTRESFLNLGPLKRAEARGNRCVIGVEAAVDLPQVDFDTITDFVNDRLPTGPSTERLRPDNRTHRLLLIADLVDLLLITKPPELQSVLYYFDVQISIPDLEQSAKLLEFLGLMRIEHRGNEHFFVRKARAARTWVDYSAQDGKPVFDRS